MKSGFVLTSVPRYSMRIALIFLTLLASPVVVSAQIISGTLMEVETRTLLSSGSVTLLDGDSVTVAVSHTDSAGAFHFALPRGGPYRLLAQQVGFRAAISPRLVIGARDTLEVEFSLARDVVVLEPLVITARTRRLTPAGERFYERARTSIMGDFITRTDIDRLHPLRTTELLNRIPGVRLFPVLGGNSVSIRGSCRPSVYVDGVRVAGYRTIDDLVQPLDLEGVEVYRAASSAPVEYAGMGAGCAAILLWTRIE